MNQLKAVLPWVRPYRKEFALGLFMVVISNVFAIAGPYFMKLAIDGLGDPDITGGRIGSYAGMIVLAAILGGGGKFGMRQIMNGVSRRIECDLRDDFFRHLLSLDASFFARTRTGDLMSRATNDTLAVRMAVGPGVMYAVNTLVSLILSDVIGDPLDSIASGPTAPDTTTYEDAREILHRYGVWEEAPEVVRLELEALGAVDELLLGGAVGDVAQPAHDVAGRVREEPELRSPDERTDQRHHH